MSVPITFALTADVAQGKQCFVDANSRRLEGLGILCGTTTFAVTVEESGVAADISALSLVLSLKAWNNADSTDNLAKSTAVSVTGSVATFTMSTLTTEALTYLLDEPSKDVALVLSSATNRLAVGKMKLLSSYYLGTEDTPFATQQHEMSATRVPTVDDDTTLGYSAGSLWVFGKRIFWCLIATDGAAVWDEITAVELCFDFAAPGNDTLYLIPYAKTNYSVIALSVATESGTITAALKIDGTSVTSISAVSVTGTFQTATATGANTLNANSRLSIVTTSDSSAVHLQGSVLLRRV